MKADTTRSTFKQAKHYNAVRLQQGRVSLDADWNEQVDISGHRIETETVDIIGHCGAPMHYPGFHIVANANDLTAEEKTLAENQGPPAVGANDLLISAGRYYDDGIMCENDRIVLYTKQPDLPNVAVINAAGTYVAYLDVWSRNITALEDASIREVALGGPDTATRSKTIWQVKLFKLNNANADCSTVLADWNAEIAAGGGKLAARAAAGQQSNDPCIVAPGAGYRRLENQHYRVEVHNKGPLGTATFKWSRDNGSVVTRWESQSTNDLMVSSPGRDKVLSFAAGNWIELSDDTNDLLSTPGTLVQLTKVEGNVLTIDPTTANPAGPVNIANFPKNPKIRRWDMTTLLKPANQNWIELEDGVQVKFVPGNPDNFKTGDYWLIPARTATADVEWPIDATTNQPALQLPFGVEHHYCRLAIAKHNGSQWTSITDCRPLFPPLTELVNFFYVGGDGQEVMPDLTQPNNLTALDLPLEAGVTRGIWPIKDASVRFTVIKGNGKLQPGNATSKTVPTGVNGVAACNWSLDSTNRTQQVEAVLLDSFSNPICEPIHFLANLSVASEVAYNPGNCGSLQNQKTVQQAIDKLASLVSLYKVSGDDQSRTLNEQMDPLVVIAASKCGPVAGMKVEFKVKSGGGSVSAQPVTTDPQGLAKCTWTLGSAGGAQVVEAVLQPGPGQIVAPVSVEFQAQVRMPAGADQGFQVTKISVPVQGGAPQDLKNNMDVVFTSLGPGVQFDCNDGPDPAALASKHPSENPVCGIAVDVPFPLSPDEINFYALPPSGFRSVILGGKASLKQTNSISWVPTVEAMNWLNALFAKLKTAQSKPPQRVLARLTLRGNFIWSDKNPEVMLDADVFAVKDQNVITLPSGDQRKGGTLDMWFWLVPPFSFTLTAFGTGFAVVATVLDNNGKGVAGAQVELSLDDGTSPPPKVTGTDGKVTFSGVPVGFHSVTATKDGMTQVAAVRVGKPGPG